MKRGCAVTIGFFDGVHLGHRCLLHQLERWAADEGLRAAIVTFDRHPREVVTENFVPALLTTQEEKLTLLSKTFGGEIVVLPFTEELGALTAPQFMQSILLEKLNTKLLLMGYNHQFGHGGGTPEAYANWGKEIGIKVCHALPLTGEKVSSSRIRSLIAMGEIEKSGAMLGYPYFLTGKVTVGKQIGRQIGFPTANLLPAEKKLLPACGVYAVWVVMPDGTRRKGMLCIGHRPTTEANGDISVEVHILDFNGNLYGESLRVEFIARLREERHFASLDALRRQLMLDASDAREIIGRPK